MWAYGRGLQLLWVKELYFPARYKMCMELDSACACPFGGTFLVVSVVFLPVTFGRWCGFSGEKTLLTNVRAIWVPHTYSVPLLSFPCPLVSLRLVYTRTHCYGTLLPSWIRTTARHPRYIVAVSRCSSDSCSLSLTQMGFTDTMLRTN